MEKLVKVPFNVETAKKIQNGEIEGKIVTRDGHSVRVICWDRNDDCPIVILISIGGSEAPLVSVKSNGRYICDRTDSDYDLFLQLPEWTTFKDGDIIRLSNGDLLLLKGRISGEKELYAEYYAGIFSGKLYMIKFTKARKKIDANSISKGSNKDRKKFIRLLKENGSDDAISMLNKNFGVNVEKKYKDGDVLCVKTNDNEEYVFIYKEGAEKTHRYCSVCLNIGNILFTGHENVVCDDKDIISIRYATESEKGVLLETLKESDEKEAKEYLKRFFNIEWEHKFKPFDKVLVRDSDDDEWYADFFSHYDKMHPHRYLCITRFYKQCIPYKGNEHLLGTTDNPE